jgi:hypothetical protein
MITITAARLMGTIYPGDRVTFERLDHRSWWQRVAPRWLGGQSKPQPFEGVIGAIINGHSFEAEQIQ